MRYAFERFRGRKRRFQPHAKLQQLPALIDGPELARPGNDGESESLTRFALKRLRRQLNQLLSARRESSLQNQRQSDNQEMRGHIVKTTFGFGTPDRGRRRHSPLSRPGCMTSAGRGSRRLLRRDSRAATVWRSANHMVWRPEEFIRAAWPIELLQNGEPEAVDNCSSTGSAWNASRAFCRPGRAAPPSPRSPDGAEGRIDRASRSLRTKIPTFPTGMRSISQTLGARP